MLRFRDYSITKKLTWMNMLVSGAALFLACGAFITCDTILFRQSMVRNLAVQADIISSNSAAALLFNDPNSAEDTLAALRAAPHVIAAWIYTPDGKLFADYKRDRIAEVPKVPPLPRGATADHWFRDGRLDMVRAVIFQGKTTAYVYIQCDLGGLYQRLGTYAEISIGVLLCCLLAAFLVSSFSGKVVAKPIKDLSETAHAVSRDKNYSVRATHPDGRDEITELVETFNAMLAQIQQRESEREQLLENERGARTQAERASLLKDEFLATLSHELRTPLNAITGWTHVLRSRGFKDPELVRGLTVIDRNTRAQSQLVEDMLDMSRIMSGKTHLDVQQVDLQDVVKSAVASVQHSADAKGIRLRTILDPEASPVRGDPGRLQQCLWNLLSNAIKFTPQGGEATVALQCVKRTVQISVSDTGEGITPQFLPHIFERFRQADASTTRHHGGLGLGLSIVKHLVELHGGSISAQSAGKGKGASFVMELPLLAALPGPVPVRCEPQATAAQTPGKSDAASLSGISVLAIDDDLDARDLIKHVLEDNGARVILAGSSEEGLELLHRERPDIIISDIGMPGEDGYEFIRKVRALSPAAGGRTPAAALTAFAGAEDRIKALQAGYQIHAAKPVKPAELTSVVVRLATRS